MECFSCIQSYDELMDLAVKGNMMRVHASSSDAMDLNGDEGGDMVSEWSETNTRPLYFWAKTVNKDLGQILALFTTDLVIDKDSLNLPYQSRKNWRLLSEKLPKGSRRENFQFLTLHSDKNKVERIRRIPSHRVAALHACGIDRGTPFRDCIDNLLIDLQGKFPLMINKVIKHNKESTPKLKGHLTIELNQINTCFTFQQVLYSALL